MAINKISNPNSSPTAVSDYQAQNNIIAALLLKTGLGYIVSGTNIVSGAVFNLGASTYKADADTAISGSPTDYVKITPSGATASASFVSNLSGVSWNATYQGYYDGSGNLYVFDEYKAYYNGVIASYHYDKTSDLVNYSDRLLSTELFTANITFPGATADHMSAMVKGETRLVTVRRLASGGGPSSLGWYELYLPSTGTFTYQIHAIYYSNSAYAEAAAIAVTTGDANNADYPSLNPIGMACFSGVAGGKRIFQGLGVYGGVSYFITATVKRTA